MTISPLPIHPADLSPDQRRREFIELLARAVLRLHERAALAGDAHAKNTENSQQNELANGPQQSVTVSRA